MFISFHQKSTSNHIKKVIHIGMISSCFVYLCYCQLLVAVWARARQDKGCLRLEMHWTDVYIVYQELTPNRSPTISVPISWVCKDFLWLIDFVFDHYLCILLIYVTYLMWIVNHFLGKFFVMNLVIFRTGNTRYIIFIYNKMRSD